MNPFKKALNSFTNDIASIYLHHESTFDWESFHGRFHILRCLYLAKAIITYYNKKVINIDETKVYHAIMFHDSARKDNGIDAWEKESALNCYNYLVKNNYTK